MRAKQLRETALLLFACLLAAAAGYALVQAGQLWAALALPAVVALFALRQKRRIAIRRAGADGERDTLRLLAALPRSWVVLPDVTIAYRGHKSQVDYVLLCPTAVLVLECKNLSGIVSGKAGDRELRHYKPAKNGRPAEQKTLYNPVKQVQGHAITLGRVLSAAGLDIPVHTGVYFANPRADVRIDGATHIWTASGSRTLTEILPDFAAKQRERVPVKQAVKAIRRSMVR